jgi:hypothetical protein
MELHSSVNFLVYMVSMKDELNDHGEDYGKARKRMKLMERWVSFTDVKEGIIARSLIRPLATAMAFRKANIVRSYSFLLLNYTQQYSLPSS